MNTAQPANLIKVLSCSLIHIPIHFSSSSQRVIFRGWRNRKKIITLFLFLLWVRHALSSRQVLAFLQFQGSRFSKFYCRTDRGNARPLANATTNYTTISFTQAGLLCLLASQHTLKQHYGLLETIQKMEDNSYA